MAMYCNWCVAHQHEARRLLGMDSSFGQIKPTPSGFVVPYGNLTGLGGDVHDTYRVKGDNVLGGHTTFNIPGFERKRVHHD